MAVKEKKTLISVLELKRLLVELKEKRPDICFRYRLLGEMWKINFMRILNVSETSITLNDEYGNRLMFIQDLTQVMQFEIDARFQLYEPHFHYDVHAAEAQFS